MKHQLSLIAAALVALAGPAVANRDMTRTSGNCQQFLRLPTDARDETLAWEQRLSLASCRQTFVVQPTRDPARFRDLVDRIDEALQPSIAIYEDAAAHGPPQIRILAEYGLGMTHVNAMVRARNAVHDNTQDPQLHQQLEPLLEAHRLAAAKAFREVDRLAGTNPAAARENRVMTYAVADAREQTGRLQSTATARR